jgi:lipopolysaccharide transport system permease protein
MADGPQPLTRSAASHVPEPPALARSTQVPELPQQVSETPAPSPPDDAASVEFLDPVPSLGSTIREAWRSRSILVPMGQANVSAMFAMTKVGRGWLVVRPFADVVGKAFLFGAVLGVAGAGGVPYFLMMLVALIAWRTFDRALFIGTRSFDQFSRLMRQFDLPLLLVPTAGLAPIVVHVGIYVVILALALAYYAIADGTLYLQLDLGLLVGLAGFALCVVCGWSLVLWTSVFNAYTRDTRQAIRYVLQFWLYLTPVLYPLSQLPSSLEPLAHANPMTAPIEMVKAGLIDAGTVNTGGLVWSLAFVTLVLASGLVFFSRKATNFMGPSRWGRDDDDYAGGDF